mgnify:FL=1
MIFLNNLFEINTILNLLARPTKHLTVVGAMFTSKSNWNNMVKTNKSLKFIHGQNFEGTFTHPTGVFAILGNHFFIGIVKNKVIIGTHYSLSSIVPVFVASKKAARWLFTFLESTTTFMRAELSWRTILIRKAVTALLANPSIRVDFIPGSFGSRFVSMPLSKVTDRSCCYLKVVADFFNSSVFLIVKPFKFFRNNLSSFSFVHIPIIAQAIPKQQVYLKSVIWL